MPPQSAQQAHVGTELRKWSPPWKRLLPVPAQDLKSWYQQYTAQDGGTLRRENALIRAVRPDVLDHEQVEAEVQQLILETVVADGFCTKCRHLLDHWPKLMLTDVQCCVVGRHFRANELEAAARLGCRFCALLLGGLRYYDQLDAFRKIEARLRDFGDCGTASLSIGEHEQFVPYNLQILWLNFPGKVASRLGEPTTMEVMFVSQILPPSVNLWEHPVDDPFAIARMWLERCSESHEYCRNKRHLRPPSRLISIGNGVVKLVVTASLPAPPQYATLSYCWGSKPFTMLTQDNLPAFLDHIPLDELPQTFIDAIDAARRLGIDYIWIDALCIIQKDENNRDWANEAGHMSAVYGGTFLNIAATAATSVYDGFIHSSRPKYHDRGFIARVTASDHCRAQNFRSTMADEESIISTHLATRAWALQERLLSPRTIYFGESGLFWKCRTHISSEFLPDGSPDLDVEDSAVAEETPWDWTKIVEQYSPAKLTFGSDRLPALSGIAARQQQVTGGQYLAGMWRESLIEQLSWEVLDKTRSHRPEWRAPTWSWASIDGEVMHFGLEDCNKYVQVVDAWTRPSGPDPYGAVADGELTLSCTHLFHPNINTSGNVGMHAEDQKHVESNPGGVRINFDCLEEVGVLDLNTCPFYILPVIEGETEAIEILPDGEILESKRMIRGLFLQPSSDPSGSKHLRRVGSFHVSSQWDETRDTGLYQECMDTLKIENSPITAAELSRIVPASEDEDGRLVIVIK